LLSIQHWAHICNNIVSFSQQPKSKITASRKLSLKIMLLTRAMEQLEQETQDRDEEKLSYLGERLPPLQFSGLSLAELQVRDKQYDWAKLIHELKLKPLLGTKHKGSMDLRSNLKSVLTSEVTDWRKNKMFDASGGQ
uniref:Uncharacterized protein n=1 Tax=Oncorhynchus kisutch TaxID=8019 RepID=A0A8C7KM96_ONCKI